MITAVIVDDEAALRTSLLKTLELFCPDVKVIGEAEDVKEAIQVIGTEKPQVVFLDIALPDGTGFDILKQIATQKGSLDAIDFKVIFTTAHEKYAVEAFRFSALDYLMKPIEPHLLEAALEKFRARTIPREQSLNLDVLFKNMEQLSSAAKKISLVTSEKVYVCLVSDILYCEAEGSYTRFHIKDKKPLLISKALKDYEELLHDQGFERIHQSYLININHLKTYVRTDGGYVVMDNGDQISVSKRKRDQLLHRLKAL